MKKMVVVFLVQTVIAAQSAFAQQQAGQTGQASQTKQPKHVRDTLTLTLAVVTARRPLIEQKPDRLIVNVDAMITAAGSNALDVLSKSPGVIVDANENISLNGKSNVLVLVDGRPTYMSGPDLAAYLRSLPAGMLDKLELIPSPPAGYDAAGGAVIDIVLKKLHTAGFNGGINAGYNQGVYGRSNDAVNLNYRRAKTNVFGNLGYSLDQNYNDQGFSRSFYNPQSSTQQISSYHYRSNGWNARVGMDFFPNAQTTLGFMVNGATRPKTDFLAYSNTQWGAAGTMDSSGRGLTTGQYAWRNGAINANAAHTFKASKAKLTADLDYVRFHAENSQHAPMSVVLPDGTISSSADRIFRYPGDTYIYSAKADLTLPLCAKADCRPAVPAKAEFTAGLKSSCVRTDNQLVWFDVISGSPSENYSRSNDFRYREEIYAAYVQYKKQWTRWGIQAGVRVENTVSAGHQLSNPMIPDSSFSKNYTHVFPSIFLSHKLDTGGSHLLVLSYTSRIRRPGYQQLNPWVFYQDQYTYSAGNPALQPYTNHYIELKYAYKQYVGVTAGYWYGANESQSLTQAYGEVLITRPQNYILSRSWSLVPFVALQPTKWWNLHFNAVLIYILNNGTAPGVTVDQRTNVHEFETSNEFHLLGSWSAELDGFFPGRQAFAQSQGVTSVLNISGGIRKNIVHGQGTVNLTFNDLFHTFYRGGTRTIDIDGVSAYSTRQTDTRRIGLAFSYHFGKAANARKVQHNGGGAQDEESRTK